MFDTQLQTMYLNYSPMQGYKDFVAVIVNGVIIDKIPLRPEWAGCFLEVVHAQNFDVQET